MANDKYMARSGKDRRDPKTQSKYVIKLDDRRSLPLQPWRIKERRKHYSDQRYKNKLATPPMEASGVKPAIENRVKERRNLKNVNPFPEELRRSPRRFEDIKNSPNYSRVKKMLKNKKGLLGLGIAIGSALAKAQEAYAKEK